MNEMKELSQLFSNLCSASILEVCSSENLTLIEGNLMHLVSRCSGCSPQSWPHEAEGNAAELYLNFFDCCKRIYQHYLCVVRESSAVSNESLKRILNLTYELQCFFVSAMPQCDALRNDLYNSTRATKFCLLLLEVSNIADQMDPRISLPLWKLLSSIMQQYKNELSKNATAVTGVLGLADSTQSSILDFMLRHLLDSVQHFMEACLKVAKVSDGSKAVSNTNLKMLNLLNRIATFCIREFSATSLTGEEGIAGGGLMKWLQWMIKTRYCGGIYASGTGFPETLVQTFESSVFLAIDVSLGHLLALPIAQNKECSVAVAIFRHKDLSPAVKCRICGTLMAGLARQPQFYTRWFNDDFNLFEEFFSACAKIQFKDLVDESAGVDLLKSLCAITDEFYTTLLTQICACICGLPASCFTYLESALLSGLLSDHQWTVILATDVWCFLARYGTGELCWQYATTFAEAIYRSARQIFHTTEVPGGGGGNPDKSILCSLTRLGWLLARLVVFLTPKQQAEFLRIYPLSSVTVLPGEELPPSLLWWFVPLEVERLQKIAQSIVRDCLTERISQSPCTSQSNTQSATCNIVNAAAMLYLADGMPSSWREANATGLAQFSVFTMAQLQAVSDHDHLFPCATWLSAAARRPVSAVLGHLTCWSQRSPHLVLITTSPLGQLLQWLLTTLSPDSESMPPDASFLSFTVLCSCYLWVVFWESQFSADTRSDSERPTPLWIRQLCSLLRSIPTGSVDIFISRPIVESLNQKLDGVQPCENLSHTSTTELCAHVRTLESAFNVFEEKWKDSSFLGPTDVAVLKHMVTRLSTIIDDVERMDWA